MLRSLIAALIAVSIWVAPVYAQSEQTEANDVSTQVVKEFLVVSQLPGLYANLLKYMDLIATPELRALQQEAMDSVLTPKEDMALAQRVMTLFPLIAAAGTDLQSGFNENRIELIQDAAELVKLILTEGQQEKLLQFLKLSSVRKMFDALYAVFEYPPSWTVQDSQVVSQFDRWAETVNLSLEVLKKSPKQNIAPTEVDPDRLKFAQVIMAEVVRVTRLQEIQSVVIPFMKETVLPRAKSMSEIDRQKLSEDLNAFDGDYSGLRNTLLNSVPQELAAALTAEQLREFHDFVKTDTATKFFDYIFKIVQAATAITGADLDELEAFVKSEKELLAAADLTPETRQAAELQLQTLGFKWMFTLSESISAETREKLLAAFMEMSMEALPR